MQFIGFVNCNKSKQNKICVFDLVYLCAVSHWSPTTQIYAIFNLNTLSSVYMYVFLNVYT